MEPDYDEAADGLLVRRAQDGDARAFGALVRRHAPYLRRFAIKLTGSVADADDVVQEAMIAAWDRLDSLHSPDRFRAWARTIVSTRGIDLIRARRQPAAELDESVPDDGLRAPDRRAEASSGIEALAAALEALPEGQRHVWLLREVEGERYEAIADRLGVTTAVVRGRLARARAALVTELEDWR